MSQVRLFHKNKIWSMVYSSDDTMNLVGFLITDEIPMKGVVERIKWLLNGREDSIGCNYIFMEKEHGNAILACLFDEDPYYRALIVPIPVMIDLLEQWATVCKMNPDEVIITYDQGKFHVEGKILNDSNGRSALSSH